ncbi:MAG: UPF0175 family protein [Candidatus Methanospirareceae archaeon]
MFFSGKASTLAEVTRWEFEEALGQRQIRRRWQRLFK